MAEGRQSEITRETFDDRDPRPAEYGSHLSDGRDLVVASPKELADSAVRVEVMVDRLASLVRRAEEQLRPITKATGMGLKNDTNPENVCAPLTQAFRDQVSRGYSALTDLEVLLDLLDV